MNRHNRSLRCRLLATTIIASALAAPAFAQEAPDATQVRTISTMEIESISPVVVIDGNESRARSLVRAEDMLNALPQIFADEGAYISNGATGTATVDLRGLGAARTLVLLNGRRIAPATPDFLAADLNVIPALMLERVEVATGAAAAAHGPDALSGAVNFVLDTDFEGFRIDLQAGVYQHNNDDDAGLTEAYNRRAWDFPQGNTTDGDTYNINVAYGTSFDNGRGHVAAYAGYRQNEEVRWSDRDFSACATQARTPAQVALEPDRLVDCGGSATTGNGTIFIQDGGTSSTFQIGPNRTLIPGITPYNYAPVNYLQRPDERFTAGVFASYELSPVLRPYLEMMFMQDQTESAIAPSGNFGNTLTLNCGAPGSPTLVTPGIGNPLLSAQQRALICDAENLVSASGNGSAPVGQVGGVPQTYIDPTTGLPYRMGYAQILRRNVEGGARINELEHTSYRFVVGSQGDLDSAWSYDAYAQYSRTEHESTYLSDMSITRLTRAIDVIDDPRTAGVDPICRSVLDNSDPNCVPWDIFATGQVTDAALAYVSPPGWQSGMTDQAVIHGSVTGNLSPWGVQSPWAKGHAFATFGAEYRRDSLDLDVDALSQVLPNSDFAGQGAPTLPYDGDFDVREVFADIRMPLVEDGFVRDMTLAAGYRFSDYNFGATTHTYHVGVNAEAISGVWVRAGFNRAASPPSVRDLFLPQRIAINGGFDPCSYATPSASLAACQAMGVTPAQYGSILPNPAGQYNGLVGGNPNLDPEVSDTFTIGATVQPAMIPNLTVSVDYFDIKLEDAHSLLDQDQILDGCATTQDPFLCGLVERDTNGSIWQTQQGFVRDIIQNRGSIRTSGVDISASYALELGTFGSVDVRMQGTMLDKLDIDNGMTASFDCAGYFGPSCGTPAPEWTHRVQLEYATPLGWDASLQWRYFGAVDVDNKNPSPALNRPFAPFNEQIDAQSYIDLSLSTRFADAFGFRVGINNIFDKSPPIFGANGANTVINACGGVRGLATCNANTFPNVYDALGRYVFAGITVDF